MFGIVSLVFWALIVMVSLKYVVLILRADNEGEGGILALLSLVAGDRIAWSPRIPLLVILGVIGAALLYGDGVITPAISVLSAMEGLKLIAPHFEQFTVPVTIVILIGLFLIQRRGTQSIGKLFGPVMLVWFLVIGAARCGPHLGCPGDPQGGQSGRGRTFSERRTRRSASW